MNRPLDHESTSAAIFVLVLGSVTAALKWASKIPTDQACQGKSEIGESDDNNAYKRNSAIVCPTNGDPLPTHLQRELYKVERMKALMVNWTRSKPMYDNIVMRDPQGTVLSTISIKKARWYVRKGLAVWGDDNEKAIQLIFQPKAGTSATLPSSGSNPQIKCNSSSLREYNSSFKFNRCVGCGAEHDYMKHYIVPHSYRTLFPDHFKTHLPHDIVLLCASRCQLRAQQETHHRMKELEERERQRQTLSRDLHPTSGQAEIVDRYKDRVRSAATALLRWKAKLPDRQIEQYERLVCDWVRNSDTLLEDVGSAGDLSKDRNEAGGSDYDSSKPSLQQLEIASMLQCRSPNPHYVSGAELVVNALKTKPAVNKDNGGSADDYVFDEEALAKFVRDWRRLFLDEIHPQFLPNGWSVDAPVQSDHRQRD